MTANENGWAAVGLYVPRLDTDAAKLILPMSGIVGSAASQWHLSSVGASGEDMMVLDYEGAKYAHNLVTYHDRVCVAAGRHTSRYPTVARMECPRDDLQSVGFYYPRLRKIDVPGPAELMALTRWLTDDEIGEGPNLHVEVQPGSYVA